MGDGASYGREYIPDSSREYIPDSSRASLSRFLVSEHPWLRIWVPLEYAPPRVVEWL